jgi:hypothetical protein
MPPRKNSMKKGMKRVGGRRKSAQPVVREVSDDAIDKWMDDPAGDPSKRMKVPKFPKGNQ